MSLDINHLFTDICGDEVIFSDRGNYTSERINDVLEELDQLLEGAITESKAKKRIYHIIVEALQNFFHHADELSDSLMQTVGLKYGMLIVKKEQDNEGESGVRITAGNYVPQYKVAKLTERIEAINATTPDELKAMYKEVLNNQQMSEKGGGGLGLIDMARKADKKLQYHFYPDNDDFYFYRLDIFVSLK